MKKTIILMSLLMLSVLGISLIAAVPVAQNNLVGNIPITVSNPNVAPIVVVNPASRLLFNDPYGVWANGNLTSRPNNYAFTGEGITFKALVWDLNGITDVNSVNGVLSQNANGSAPNIKVSCAKDANQPGQGSNLPALGYSGVRQPSDTQDTVSYDQNSMAVYDCIYTVDPSVHGAYYYMIQATDSGNLVGQANFPEYWFLNPAMDITINGSLNFGAVQPGQTGTSNPITVQNNGEGGMEVAYRISGTDFYDPLSDGALCSMNSNELSLTSFTYSATQGSNSANGMSIPYGKDVTTSQPVINGAITSPGASMTLTFKLKMPTPCRGTFSNGQINLWSIAV